MEDVLGLVVEQLARRARAAAAKGEAVRVVLPPKTPVAPVAPPPMPATVAPPPLESIADATSLAGTMDLPFGSGLLGGPTLLPRPPSRPLLGAFAGGGAFLTGFILAEALAPPIALREPRLG